jgi:polysaccharide biosynthesis transport protein
MLDAYLSESCRQAIQPRSMARALWKQRLTILFVWAAGTLAIMAAVMALQPVYRAEALVLVESQKIPENFVAPTVQTALEVRLDRLKQQVLSRERLWGLIEEYGLYPTLRSAKTQEELVDKMRGDVTIRLERGWSASRPGAFRIAYETLDPATAASVSNRIGSFFITENLRERSVEAAGTSAFLDEQLRAAEEKLREQEARLSKFKLANNGELPQQETTLLAQLGQLKADLLGIQDALARARQNKLILDNTLSAHTTDVRRLKELTRLRDQAKAGRQQVREDTPAAPPLTDLQRAELELKLAQARYSERHPEMGRLLARVQRLREEEARSKSRAESSPAPAARSTPLADGADKTLENLLATDQERTELLQSQAGLADREIESLEQRREAVLNESEIVQSRIRKLPIREQQLAVVTRDYETSRMNYRSLLDKKLASDIAADMERWEKAEKFVMLEQARPPEKPVRPRRVMLSGAGSLGLLLLAALAAIVVELRKDTLLGEWELPRGSVVLGRLPRMQVERS